MLLFRCARVNRPPVYVDRRLGVDCAPGGETMATFIERAVGAAKLDAATYEEVEHDPGAMGQAATLIVLASLAAGLGAIRELGVLGVLIAAAITLVAWSLWALITLFVGTRLLPGPQTEADFGQLFRTLGFSAAPGVFQIAALIPAVGALIALAASLWQLAAMVVAVRQALDYESTGRAIAVCVIGFIPYALVFSIGLRWLYVLSD
jgi:hypothetical protein